MDAIHPAMRLRALLIAALVPLLLLPGCAATATHESTGEYIDDAAITAKVKAALVKDSRVSAAQVQVETFRGNVQLSGFVDSEAERTHAGTVASTVAGVREVSNRLEVKRTTGS